MEGNLQFFKPLFYFVFEGNFQVQASRGAYIWRGDLTEGFLRYESEGLIFGGACFRNLTVFNTFSRRKRHRIYLRFLR